MSRRIFKNMVLMAVLAVLLATILIVPTMYNAHEERMNRELRQEIECIVSALQLIDDDISYLQTVRMDSRITLIVPDGTVAYDSVADASQMGNHALRSEVAQAFESGSGESIRRSDTLAETTVYYARRTDDGSVLRIGNTRRSQLGTLMSVLPLMIGILLGVVLFSMLLAQRVARRIVAPINALDLDAPLENDAYDELAPLLTRMHRQHRQIQGQMQAMENARAELAAILENMREGMILLDGNETVLSINGSAARIFGVDANAIVGQNLLRVDRNADLHARVRQVEKGEAARMTLRRDGKNYRIYISPVAKGETIHGTVLLILDVTQQLAAEEIRREFTANVSHELKTPLTSISGFAEIIRDGIAQPQDIPRFAGMICGEAERMITLVNDILELSKLDEGQNLGTMEDVDLLPMLRELTERFSPSVTQKKLALRLDGDDATICAYPILLREMFFNLIDNAVKYTPEGGEISISIKMDGDQIICSVQDNGMGIPTEHQAHVFERFYRADKSHSRRTGGTGLGLAIVKHVAQIHNAEICLQSADGRGTQIRVIFNSGKAK